MVFGSLNGDQVELKEVKTRGETGHVRSRLSTTRMTQSLTGIGIFLSKRGECVDAFFLTFGKVRRSNSFVRELKRIDRCYSMFRKKRR